jgi:hypothetical protein
MAKEAAQEWVSVPDAAEILGCSPVWVLKMLKDGRLKGFVVNRRAWAVSRKSVLENLSDYEKRDRSKAGRPRARFG